MLGNNDFIHPTTDSTFNRTSYKTSILHNIYHLYKNSVVTDMRIIHTPFYYCDKYVCVGLSIPSVSALSLSLHFFYLGQFWDECFVGRLVYLSLH